MLVRRRVHYSLGRKRWERGRARPRWRSGNDEGLADLQFPVVLDVVEFLQFVDPDLVHLRDGSERLAAGDDVGVAVGGRDGRARRSRRGREACRSGVALGCSIACCRRRICWESRSILMFCSSIFLRQAEKVGALRSGRGRGLESGPRTGRARKPLRRRSARVLRKRIMGQAWHFRRTLASAPQFAFWRINGSVFSCQNGRKNRWRPCRGGRSKAMAAGPKRPTFPSRTRGIC